MLWFGGCRQSLKDAQPKPHHHFQWQVCNWILYYKRDLWGVPLSELLAKKEEVTQVTREGETPEQLGNKMVY